MTKVTLQEICAARQAIKGHCLFTPLVPFSAAGCQIYLKAENLQPSGSFKIRGATYCLSLLSAEQRRQGVVAYSTGNHAQAVALAAQRLGIKATIVMSPDVKPFKIEATRHYGATVILVSTEERSRSAQEIAHATGAYFVPPFDHPAIIAGQGTIGLEILEELLPSTIFVPVGGGGLIAGIAFAIKEQHPHVRIIGVEPELEDDGYRSFKSGHLVQMDRVSDTLADAVKIPMLGELTYPLIKKYVDEMITVTEKQIATATLLCVEKGHLFVEPSGALALAGALASETSSRFKGPIVCVASGGNMQASSLQALLSPGHRTL